MGPDADQANVLLLTFKTKIEEAVSLVNQMPEDMRQDVWQFWQKVSTVIKAATIGIKKRKPVPGGKDLAPQPRKSRKKKLKALAEKSDDEVVEEFVLDTQTITNTTLPSDLPAENTYSHDTFAQDLKLLYSSVYSAETSDAVAAMIAINDPSSVSNIEGNKVLDNHPSLEDRTDIQSQGPGSINIVVQDFVDDQVITSLVTIDNPNSPLKKIVPKPSPKPKPTKKIGVKRKPKKEKVKVESAEILEQTVSEANDPEKPKPKKTPKKKNAAKKKLEPNAGDAISKLLSENMGLPETENVGGHPESEGVTPEVGETPLAENKSANKKSEKRPRRSTRPPKPKKLPTDQQEIDRAIEGEGDGEGRKRRVYKPGEPKPDLGPVNCEVCGVQLAYLSSLAAHMRKHTGDRPFSCGVCNKPFTTKANMLRHEKTHSGEKPFECEECHKCFTEKKTLKVHMRSHTGERPFKCPECSMAFTQSGTLKTHMHRHSGHKGNLCDLCGRAFRQKSQLRIHLRRHFNLKSYQCDKCDQTFYCKGDLTRHELRHTGERPFACAQCPKTFTRLQYLKEHENQHNGVTPYSCDICSIKFSDHSSHYRHLQKHKKTIMDASTEDQVHLVVDSEAIENETVDSVPALLVTADHIQHLFGVNTSNQGEVYRIALVDQTMDEEHQVQDPSQADFSAINLLANATTQLSMTQDTDSDLKQISLPQLLN
ncbi:zinc finger protein 37-like [Haliotis rubra]|uniref:zinc finger protein 37-like n=1 Tax=Haliotis rubra TaxID=36100 RepID=UPI001EE5427C|nr:zinc finger protein 37-like [Haliotis rubra]